MATPAPQQNPTTQNGRGIRNTQVRTSNERFTERSEGRLSRARFLNGNESSRGRFAANDPLYDTLPDGNTSRKNSDSQKRMLALREAEAFDQTGISFTEGEREEFRSTAPAHPNFPFLIFFVALLKDFLDVIGAVTLIGWILLLPLTVCLSIILFFWTLSRLKKSYMKKRRLFKILIRFIAFLIEMVGYFNVVPLSTFFVLFTHYDESKIVKSIYSALALFAQTEAKLKHKGH